MSASKQRCQSLADPRRVALPLVVLLLAAASAAPRLARAQGDPQELFQRISVLVGAEAVFAELRVAEGRPLPEVRLELLDGAGGLMGRASALAAYDGSTELHLDRGGLSADGTVAILPGDSLRLSAAYPDGRRAQRDIPVPALGVDLAPADGSLGGWAPPGGSVLVITADARGAFASDNAAADAAGRWSVALGADLDLGPGASGTVLYTDRSGTSFQAAWSRPRLTVPAGATTLDLQLRPGEEARLTVTDAAGRQRAAGRVRGQGGPVTLALRDAAGGLVGLRPGDRLNLDFAVPAVPTFPPRPAMSLDWPAITVVVDPSADAASGKAPPGTAIKLAPEGRPSAAQTVVADAAGAWRADWAGKLDLAEDQALLVTLPDNPGLSLTARASALEWVDPYVARATGRGVAGARVSMRLVDAAGQVLEAREAQVGVEGRFGLRLDGDAGVGLDGGLGRPRSIGDGNRLELAADGDGGGWQATLGRLDLALSADADADTVGGRARPGSRVRARLAPSADWVEGLADGEGSWLLDLAGRDDLVPGSLLELQLRGEDGIDRGLRFPVFRLSVFVDSGRFEVDGPPGLEVPVELERGGMVLGSGSCRVPDGETACAGQLRLPQPGDTVLAFPERSASARLQLAKMTAHIDPVGRDVTGQSPAGQTVDIAFANDQGPGLPAGVRAPIDNTGVYDYEVPNSQWDLLVPGLVADVYHSAAGGHRSAARGLLESLALAPQAHAIMGAVEVGSSYLVEAFDLAALDVDGRPKEGAQPFHRQAGSGNAFGVFIHTNLGSDPVPGGSLLRLTHGRGVRAMRVPDLGAWLLDDEGRVAGWTLPFSRVHARYRPRAESWDSHSMAVFGHSDGDGRFLLAPPVLDLRRMDEVELRVESGQGRVIRYLDPASRPRRVYLPWTANIPDQHASP